MRHRASKVFIDCDKSDGRLWLGEYDSVYMIVMPNHALSFAKFLRRAAEMIEKDADRRKPNRKGKV